jgi:hypothetical protein
MLSAKARLVRCDKVSSTTTPLSYPRPPAEPAVCSTCQAVWHQRVWSLDPATRRKVRRCRDPIAVISRGCQGTREGNPTGIRCPSHADMLVRVYWRREAIGPVP